jgi:DNA-directed RNA polymerase subunit RPC12/RpoP
MLAKCQCNNCSQPLAFEATDAGAVLNCPNCGAETLLVSPHIPSGRGEKVADGDFYVWLDQEAEGPLQSQQLLELSREFPEMAWSFAGGPDWIPLSDFQRELEKARLKERAEQKIARRKEWTLRKNQVLELERDIAAKMAGVRSQARLQSAAAGENWLGLYDSGLAADQRRAISAKKEADLLFLEQQKANTDEILAQIDKELTQLEADEP